MKPYYSNPWENIELAIYPIYLSIYQSASSRQTTVATLSASGEPF